MKGDKFMFIFDCNKQIFCDILCSFILCNLLGLCENQNLELQASEKLANAGKGSPFFWTKKKTAEWTASEVELFLRDSPWAKTGTITVQVKPVGNSGPGETRAVLGAVRGMTVETCCRTIELASAGQHEDPATLNSPDGRAKGATESSQAWTLTTRVLWFSSFSVRRAMIRQREIQGISMEQAAAALAPSNDIVLALSGSFTQLLKGLPLDEIKKASFIKAAKGSKRKLPPTDYIPAQPDADPTAFIIFPKLMEGKPVFTLEDGPVTFSLEGADFKLECQFALSSMVVEGKLDW
jgi:hypothetical protein